MRIQILERTDLDEVMETNSFKTIWLINPLIDKPLAESATRNLFDKILSGSQSFGCFKNDKLVAYIIGSIPQWDSNFFGFDSYNIRSVWYNSIESLEFLINNFNKQVKDWEIRYVFVKIPGNNIITIRCFEKFGYSLADFRVSLNRMISDESSFPTQFGNQIFELANEEDIEEIAQISRKVSKVDRFHNDSNFPGEKADQLYYEWIVNGAKNGKDVIKCTIEGKLVGFHMSYAEDSIKVKKTPIVSITDILGVNPKFGGHGIGTGLFKNYLALAKLRGQKLAMSGVHVDNTISMRLHEGVGYKVFHSEIGLRKWL